MLGLYVPIQISSITWFAAPRPRAEYFPRLRNVVELRHVPLGGIVGYRVTTSISALKDFAVELR